jgi:hypothetical protein
MAITHDIARIFAKKAIVPVGNKARYALMEASLTTGLVASKLAMSLLDYAKEDTFENRFGSLADLIQVQDADGNWNHSPYMRGLANGLILAQATGGGWTPCFHEIPEDGYIQDRPDATTTNRDLAAQTPFEHTNAGRGVVSDTKAESLVEDEVFEKIYEPEHNEVDKPITRMPPPKTSQKQRDIAARQARKSTAR